MNRYVAGLLAGFIALFAVLSAIGQTVAASSGQVPHGGAIVLDFSGKVKVHGAGGDSFVIARNGVVPQGAVIETDPNAKVLLRLEDGSEILLRESSHLVMNQETLPSGSTFFELILGKLRAVVTKRYRGTPSFQLGTPSAIVAVRGTRFEVEVNNHKVTEVDVEQGLVQVTGRAASEPSVLLEPGFSTRVGLDRIPEAPVPTSRIRPDAREEQENKSKKNMRGKGSAHEPSGATPEARPGTEPPEPAEPAETPKPAPQ